MIVRQQNKGRRGGFGAWLCRALNLKLRQALGLCCRDSEVSLHLRRAEEKGLHSVFTDTLFWSFLICDILGHQNCSQDCSQDLELNL